MIHLALQVAAFLFLAAVGLVVLAIVGPVVVWLVGLPFRVFFWADRRVIAWSSRHESLDEIVSTLAGSRSDWRARRGGLSRDQRRLDDWYRRLGITRNED